MAYTTWNPSDKGADVTLSGGNLTAATSGVTAHGVRSVDSKTSGKWYWEVHFTTLSSSNAVVGVANASASVTAGFGGTSNSLVYYANGNIVKNGAVVTTVTAYSTNYIGVAWDADAGTVKFYLDNVLQATISGTNVPTGALFAALGGNGNGGNTTSTTNFGATAFNYTPPTGYGGFVAPNTFTIAGDVTILAEVAAVTGSPGVITGSVTTTVAVASPVVLSVAPIGTSDLSLLLPTTYGYAGIPYSTSPLPLIVAASTGGEQRSILPLPLIVAAGTAVQQSTSRVPLIQATGFAAQQLPVSILPIQAFGLAVEQDTIVLPSILAFGYAPDAAPRVVPAIQAFGLAAEQATLAFPAILAHGESGWDASVKTLPAIQASGTATWEYSTLGLPAIQATGAADSDPIPQVLAPTAAGTALLGLLATSDVSLPRIAANGTGGAYNASAAKLPFVIAASIGDPGNLGQSTATLQIVASGAALPGVLGQSAAIVLPLLVPSGTGFFALAGSSAVSVPLVLAQGLAIRSASAVYTAVAIHTELHALTTYTNFPFNSFARFNGVTLAAGDSGLFALSGSTDDGVAIDAAARVGISDFGSSHLKKVDKLYIGYRTDGNLILRIFTDEVNVRDYLLTATGKAGLHGNHVRIGKGLQARYWQFEVRNQNGSDLELNMLELKPTILRRRVGGDDA